VVAGVDGSPESIEALRFALEEGRLRGTSVRAVLAWQLPPLLAAGDPFVLGSGFDPSLVEPSELRRVAQERLAAAVAQATSAPGAVEQQVVEGHPAECLVAAAADAELLVVGSRGRGGFGGLLLGSVGQACAQHARCPVVIVRGPARAGDGARR